MYSSHLTCLPWRGVSFLALLITLSVTHVCGATTPVDYEDEGWRYDDSGVDPGATWMEPAFDDSGWAEGVAELGFGEGDEGTELNNHGGYTYYARRTFEVGGVADLVAGYLDLVYDDGAVVYLNGVEVDRFDMPAGAITHNTGAAAATGPEIEVTGWTVDPSYLVEGENVLAVSVHQYNVASSDLSLDAQLCFGVDRGPYLLEVDTNSAKVMWGSCVAGDSSVDYGPTAMYGFATYDPTVTTIHEVELTGLTADTEYHYRVNSGGVAGVDRTFTTAPGPGTDFTFAFYGDSREGTDIHAGIAAQIVAEAPSLVIHGGDMVSNGPSWNQWGEYFFDPAVVLLPYTPLLPVPGNHEGPFDYPQNYYDDLFPPAFAGELYYSAAWGDVRFVVVDTNDEDLVGADPEASDQYAWLESELAAATEPIVIVVHHHPVYSSGRHFADDDVLAIQQYLVPLYVTHGVDAVLCSHEHFYERSFDGDLHTLLVGGGGAPLAPYTPEANPYQEFQADDTCYAVLDVAGDELWATVYDGDGVPLEPDSILLTNDAPAIVLDPRAACDGADQDLEVSWTDDDPDSAAWIEFWLDTDGSDCGGEPVGVGYSENALLDAATLDVSAVPDGTYHLCAVISDELRDVEAYASGTIRVYHPIIGGGDEVLAMGSSWRYLDAASFPGWDWKRPWYDDSSWGEGCAELGYGDGDESTVLGYGPDPDDKYPTAYFRTTFELTNPLPSRLVMELVADDGVVVWLNNRRVKRFNMPGGAVLYDTLASSNREGAPPVPRAIPTWAAGWFVEGENVLAVEVHQAAVQSSDLSFDMRLVAIP
jgi:hypothetical protein